MLLLGMTMHSYSFNSDFKIDDRGENHTILSVKENSETAEKPDVWRCKITYTTSEGRTIHAWADTCAEAVKTIKALL